MSEHPQTTVTVPASIDMVALLGPTDEHLAVLEKAFDAELHVRGNQITLRGEPSEIALAERLLDELVTIIRTGQGLTKETVERAIGMLRVESAERPADVLSMNILSNRGRTIRPKTLNQKKYVDAIDDHTIVFGIGPAGTGKTYLAMAKAVQALQAKDVSRIILTRPAVEAGERLGFLPGTLSEKIDPYLRPLYDALHDMLDPETIPKLLTAGTIEVAPLAYMRGRAQPLDADVLTPDGFVSMGTLSVGDLVTGADGRPTVVLGVYPQGEKDVYRVTTQDGASTLACGEHLWTVRTASDKRRGKTRTLETQQMIGNLRSFHARRYELPMVQPVQFPAADVPLDPYALGLLLGDGCLTTSTTPAFATVGGGEVDAHCVVAYAQSCGSVPAEYLENSVAVRSALLQGLLDSDHGRVREGRPEFRSPLDTLRRDVAWLVQSLGGTATLRTDVVDIRLPADIAPFRLQRKADAYAATGGGRPMRFIDSIEYVGRQQTQCIQVAAADSLYVTDDFLVTHNTLNDAFIILDEAQNTSPEQMKMFLTRLGFGSKIVVTGDVTQVDLPGGVQSGLRVVEEILDGVEDVSFNRLTSGDVVRHRLVGRIVAAYDEFEAERLASESGGGSKPGRPNRRQEPRR
ncbi:phosphate starvation-inducible PhoH-like protein [Nocardioides massiliensis]|uniref:PhoH-like protein n=1 Tax=Nocardioides massiliensis TaxID=1325935 RepID=A0ABT9NPS1_9ACTN|nr:phosphate starvation-inducible PhoH-like protein [Nocardioides massiliensis]